MNIFQARSCEQKIGNLNNLEIFYMVSFSYHFIIANLTCRADAQVHNYCYNKFRSKAESCNPCADEALKYQPWTYGQLLSCMPSKLRMVVLLAWVFCSVLHCVTRSQFGGFLGSFELTYLTRKPAISFEHKIRHLRMTYSFRTYSSPCSKPPDFFLILAITFFDIYMYLYVL